MRVYLDACCLNRLTDDQSQRRIAEEAEAVEQILRLVGEHRVEWLSSTALEIETARNPDLEHRAEIAVLISTATTSVAVNDIISTRAREVERLGYGAFDALHLSAAEAGNADVLLTTDDRFIRRAARMIGSPVVRIQNPIEWLREQKT